MKRRTVRLPLYDARKLNALEAKLQSEGLKIEEPVPGEPREITGFDADGAPVAAFRNPAATHTRTYRFPRRKCRDIARAILDQTTSRHATIVVTRLFDYPHLSRYSADKVYRAELRMERQERAAAQRELSKRNTSPARATELRAHLAVRPKPAALARTVAIGRDAFDAAHSARRRRASVA